MKWLLAACLIAAPAFALPPGFQKVQVTGGLTEPTALAFLPDGRPVIAERPGRVRVVNQGGPATMLEIPNVAIDEEWGLLGLTLDPNFAANGFLYVFYTPTDITARVVRYHVQGDVADPNSATLIWLNPQPAEGPSHHGGCIAFGPDGKLYIATGEEMQSEWAQNLASQRGKILRINSDGSIPQDNPFVGVQGADPRIWAYGLRNPFRFAIDPVNSRLFVGDVGLATWEEVDRVGRGDNMGWPLMEGPECYVSDCSNFVAPIWWYSHYDEVYAHNEEACVILGPVYHGKQYPPEFQGNLFVADHVTGWIRRLILDAQGLVTSEEVFDDRWSSVTIVDMKVGPEGALYFIPIFEGQPNNQPLYRFDYVGGWNEPPVAVASANPTEGQPPLVVSFNGSASNDPDNWPDPLTFHWDFADGAGSASENPTHAFTKRGLYNTQLTVSDGDLTDTTTLPIIVGGRPAPVIVEPAEGTTYRAGDSIHFAGYALDPEDGDLPASAFSWTIVIVHHTHVHPLLGPLDGVDEGWFDIPLSGHPPEGITFRIEFTATDSDGIPTTVTRTIVPVISPIRFDTVPSGIPLFLDGNPLSTPDLYESVVNFHHAVTAQENYTLNQRVYQFVRWSTGNTNLIENLVAPEGGMSLTAVYSAECAADFDDDGFVTGVDFDLFVEAFETGDAAADFDHDDFVTGIDFDLFVVAFEHGC